MSRALGITLPLIIYYGPPGLDTQVFQSYMVSSGYQVKVVSNREGVRSALDANRDAIVVIAVDQDAQELTGEAESLRALTRFGRRIFLISPEETPELRLSGVQVIPKPYRLSELVRRIRAIAPENSRQN